MKLKKAIGAIALIAILICGIYAAGIMYQSGSTYDGSKTDVIALYENPQEYDVSNPDGVADIIVKNNLDKTVSHNVVASIVFNFRGYDTMGESFILVTAICVIMHGDSSPGGGFQGGVLAAGAFLLFFLGYGGRKNYFNYQKGYIPRLEAVAEIVYIAVAVVGICAGGNFCLNIILSHHWEIETVQFMNNAVGCNVFTGICCLLMLMLGLLDKEEGSEAK